MQCPPPQMECVHIDISVVPTAPPPKPIVGPQIPPKLLAIMAKYKYNWRIEQLSIPRKKTKKFVPKPVGFVGPVKPPPRLNNEIKYYVDQMSKPKLRNLYINKRLYGNLTKGIKKKFNKNINKAWGSIYNYYKKKERDRKLRLLRKQKGGKKKKPSMDQKTVDRLAQPKPLFKPEPVKKPSKLFTNFDRLEDLAAPKPSYEEPPKSVGISPEALTYEPTETVIRLAKPSPRVCQPPLEPGKVKRSALRYKITPKIEALAVPKQRNDKSKEDDDIDPWAISKNALKYKPTPRILELAKPVERD